MIIIIIIIIVAIRVVYINSENNSKYMTFSIKTLTKFVLHQLSCESKYSNQCVTLL